MRATKGHLPARTGRKLLGIGLASLLVLTVVGPASVSAADTRLLYVGDPGLISTPLPLVYNIKPTAVSPGNISYVDVLLKNTGKQTLTSGVVGMGTFIAENNGVPGPKLPDGWKIREVTSLSGIAPTCTFDGTPPIAPAPPAYDGVSCAFGNLARGASGTIRIFLTAGPALGTPQQPDSTDPATSIVVSGKVAEAVGGNVGSNKNTFYAYGTGNFFLSGPGLVAGLFNKNKDITPKLHGAAPTSIDLSALTGDYVVSIDETTTGPVCPAALPACKNDTAASKVSVNQGQAVTPFFVWTVLFPVPADYKLTKSTAFIHFLDAYPTDPNAYEVLYNTTQTSCLKPKAKIPCADFTLLTDPDTGLPTFLQVIFESNINSNGKYM